MTLNEFIQKWNGKKNDYDGAYENQCTDICKQWLSDLGYTVTGAWGNGKDWDKNGSRPDLQWIANTPTGVPKEGDIMVFGGGSYGHVSIFIDGNTSSFRSFDQNWPSGKLEPCGIFTHKYTGTIYVKGWLRPLKYNPTPQVDPKDARIAELTGQINDLVSQRENWNRERDALSDRIRNIEAQIGVLTEHLKDSQEANDGLKTRIKDLETELAKKPKQVIEYVNQYIEVPKEVEKEVIKKLSDKDKEEIAVGVIRGYLQKVITFIKNLIKE